MARSEQDRLLEEYLRQKKSEEETKKQFPGLSAALGSNVLRQSPEKTYKNLSKYFPPKDYLQTPRELFDYKRNLEGQIGPIYARDIYNSYDYPDFEKKISKEIPGWKIKKEFLTPEEEWELPVPETYYGISKPMTREIQVNPNYPEQNIGTLLHEIGHVKASEKGTEDSLEEKPMSPEMMRIPMNMYEKMRLMGQEHIPGYTSYEIDKPIEDIKERLKKQGFEEQEPNTNPRFQTLKAIMEK